MTDVGLGQLVTVTGRARSRKLKDAISDTLPVYKAMEEHGGIRRIDGGRTIVEEAMSDQNDQVAWVGESGSVDLVENNVLDSAEFSWRYLLGPVTWTLAEKYMNSGGSDTKYIDLVGAKFDVLEASMMNIFHAGMLSTGTGSGGLQLLGLGALVPTTATTGTVGGIDRSSANATWFRNISFYTSTGWSDGAVDGGNVKRFYDKGINYTMINGKNQVQIGLAGLTHFEFLTSAIAAQQTIVNVNDVGKSGFSDYLVYRGIKFYLSYGINYSGQSQQTATRSYLLNVKPGGVNLVFHKDAEFAMLDPVNSNDQAAVSRLMFTMAAMTCGGNIGKCWVGYD